MSRRLYFALFGAGVTITPSGSWIRNSIEAETLLTRPTKQNTTLFDTADFQGGTTTGGTRFMSFLSDPLREDYSFTTGHTVSMVIRCFEQGFTEDAYLAFVLRVMQGDTSTQRGLLASVMTTSIELGTIASTRIHEAIPFINNVSALAGDRLCLEIGVWGVTPANAAGIHIRFGDPTGTADFALVEDLPTDLVPWWEISAEPVFTIDPWTATSAPSIQLSLAPSARVTLFAAQSAPHITLSLSPSALAIAQATATPSVRLRVIAAANPVAQATPSIRLTLGPATTRGNIAAAATPRIVLALTLAASQSYAATAAPSIRLALEAHAIGGFVLAGSTVIELEYNATGSIVSIDQRISFVIVGASRFTVSKRE